ncbi:MAG TPA: 50S ribosomal protein L31 [Anaeromyxobacter sp.]
MKEAIHPDYQNAKIICNCGNVIETRSTRGDFHIEICAQCHPFFTGKQKIMDTAGRIEKFKTRYGSASSATLSKEEPKKAAAPAPAKKEAPKENRAAKRAKSGKTKAQAAAPAEAAPAAAAEPKPE